MADSDADQELADRYRAYLGLCNAGTLDRLTDLVADPLVVNGTPTSRAAYVDQIGAVLAAFPDHRWDLRDLVVNRPMVAVRLVDTGTHTGTAWLGLPATGAAVTIHEQALYTWSGSRIVEVWWTTDRLDTLRQLQQADGVT